MASAMIVLSTVTGNETLWLEPTARNSNLLPVKANGLCGCGRRRARELREHGAPRPRKPLALLEVACPKSRSWS
jgi:hypothetical protein